MYCKLLSSIRKLKAENYSELVRIFQNMKEITLHAREEPMNWQLFCSQSLKHIFEEKVEVLKMEMLYREDEGSSSIFTYLCGLFFLDEEMHVEMSEFLCEMIALAISARSSESSCVKSAIPSFLRKDCKWIDILFEHFVFRKDVSERHRTCVYDILCGIWFHSNESQRSIFLKYILRVYTPKRVVSLGKRADVFLRISREMLKSKDFDNVSLIERLVDALDMGFRELRNHPNDSVYSTLRKKNRKLSGYYLEHEPCLSCNGYPEIKIDRLGAIAGMEMRWGAQSCVVQLPYPCRLSSVCLVLKVLGKPNRPARTDAVLAPNRKLPGCARVFAYRGKRCDLNKLKHRRRGNDWIEIHQFNPSTWCSSARVGLWRSLPPVCSRTTTQSRISYNSLSNIITKYLIEHRYAHSE